LTIRNLATVIGAIAGICTTIAFLPQTLKTIKLKHTKDLSLGMYAIFSAGVFLWFLYGLILKEIPIILANGITFIFTVIIIFLIIKYK
jgi:MtN3 and saliva related transmembrane protein